MTFEEIMPTVMQWSTAAESLAALGAHLTLAQSGTEAPPEVADVFCASRLGSSYDGTFGALAGGELREIVERATPNLG